MEDRSVLDRSARPADAEMYFGQPERPLIVLIHGGFWRPEYDLTHLRPMATALAEEGWPVALLEYTRIPGRPDLMVADIKRALDNLPGNIVLMGHSAGGHLALWAASHRTNPPAPAGGTTAHADLPAAPAGGATAHADLLAADGDGAGASAHASGVGRVPVIALAPVADLELAREMDLDEGAVRDFLGDHDAGPYQPTVDGATLIHGTDDVIVPVSVSERYVSRHERCRLVAVPGEGHFALIDPESRAWPVVIDELNRLLA
jgi:acetyl esterase/lipase